MSPDLGNSNLQFDKADFGTSKSPSLSCESCGKGIDEYYFEVNTKTFCMECKRKVEALFKGGSRVKRFLKASLAGGLAALLGFGVYYGIEKTTGYEFGLVAILVGFMVGAAVRWASNGFGGWPYQLLAMFLTYNAIVLTYVPLALNELKDDFKAKPEAQTSQTVPNAAVAAVSTPQDNTAANPTPADPAATPAVAAATTIPESDDNQIGLGKFILACGALLLLAYTLPFLAGFQNILGLIILAIGLYEAWKINKGRRI
ncbi:MAG TPA: TraR/DksA C4-type zinc finger protein, partial [bacterium]|nr:TraR/DksA C4-type zinc finger protein [bacterium]